MDVVELPVLIPSGGVLVVLAWLIIHLVRQSSGDRGDYHDALLELRDQHVAEIKEVTARHLADVAEMRQQHAGQIEDLRGQVITLRGEVADLRNQVEAERAARWRAEDAAARYRRLIETHNLTEPVDDADTTS